MRLRVAEHAVDASSCARSPNWAPACSASARVTLPSWLRSKRWNIDVGHLLRLLASHVLHASRRLAAAACARLGNDRCAERDRDDSKLLHGADSS